MAVEFGQALFDDFSLTRLLGHFVDCGLSPVADCLLHSVCGSDLYEFL